MPSKSYLEKPTIFSFDAHPNKVGMPGQTLTKEVDTVLSKHEHTHSRTDSGFLSGANLTSCDDLCSTPLSQKSIPEFPEPEQQLSSKKDVVSFMRLDSGVDVGLHEQFSGLSLLQHSGKDLHRSKFENDLNCVKKSVNDVNECIVSMKNVDGPGQPQVAVVQPWELYFQQDEDGDTQLHIAIIQGFHEVVHRLIRMAPHPCLLDILNGVIQAPLHLAVLTRQARIVRELVVFGADVTRRDSNGNTALHLASEMGAMDCVRALTEPVTVAEIAAAGVHLVGLTPQLPPDLDEFNYHGEMCVHLAAKNGHLEVLRHLLWFGADVNAREGKSGRTILHMAVENADATLLRFLLEECPAGGAAGGLVLDTPTYAGHSAYQIAAVLNPVIARELLARGANIADDITDFDDHPDHNNEEDDNDDDDVVGVDGRMDEREISGLESIRSGLGSYPRSEVSVL